jgi:hypothetical protein
MPSCTPEGQIHLRRARHEFQHMIHWAQDRNEETGERGFADLAMPQWVLTAGTTGCTSTIRPAAQRLAIQPPCTAARGRRPSSHLDYFWTVLGRGTKAWSDPPTAGKRRRRLRQINASIRHEPAHHRDDLFMVGPPRTSCWMGVGMAAMTYHNYPTAFRAGPTERSRSAPIAAGPPGTIRRGLYRDHLPQRPHADLHRLHRSASCPPPILRLGPSGPTRATSRI